MLKNGKIEVQPELVEHGFVTEAELRRLKKFLKAVTVPHYKGSKTIGTGDVYDLNRVLFVAEDAIVSGAQLVAADAMSIAKRLSEQLQYIEV